MIATFDPVHERSVRAQVRDREPRRIGFEQRVPAGYAASRYHELTLLAPPDEHPGPRHTDDSSRSHLAQEPRRDVVRVDIGDWPFHPGPSIAARRGRAACARDVVRAVRGWNVHRQVEDQSMLANLEMRVVEQLHRGGAEDLAVDANRKARWQTADRRSAVAAHEDQRRGR